MSINNSWCNILISWMKYMLRYYGCYILGQLGINHIVIKKMTSRVLTYFY
jgi:hypothetical protein